MFWGKKDKQKSSEASADQAQSGTDAVAAETTASQVISEAQTPANGAVAAETDAARGSSQEAKPFDRRQAAANTVSLARLGAMVSVLRRSKSYQKHSLDELDWLLGPALATNKYVVVEAGKKDGGQIQPVGLIVWARVSDEIDARLSQTPQTSVKLDLDDYESGDNVWVLVGVGPGQVMGPTLKQLQDQVWDGKPFKFVHVNEDGSKEVKIVRTPDEGPVSA